DRSSSIRLNAEWPRAMKAFYKNPVLGTGYSSITLATDNDYLRLLGEVGMLGFLSFFLILANIFRKIWSFLKKAPSDEEKTIIIGITSGLLVFLANAFLIDIFEASKVAIIFWILAGLTISYINFEEKKYS
ncbi:MAG: hypothetical protein Q8N98_04980, partial [bacterium]|nr:hypothetical protein [bacterium]